MACKALDYKHLFIYLSRFGQILCKYLTSPLDTVQADMAFLQADYALRQGLHFYIVVTSVK